MRVTDLRGYGRERFVMLGTGKRVAHEARGYVAGAVGALGECDVMEVWFILTLPCKVSLFNFNS